MLCSVICAFFPQGVVSSARSDIVIGLTLLNPQPYFKIYVTEPLLKMMTFTANDSDTIQKEKIFIPRFYYQFI